jgi:FtsP/CotA-like multicopper oxidase with cupredoxin domain
MSLIPKKDLNNMNFTNNRTLNFASYEVEEERWFMIYNKTFYHNRIDQTVKRGTVEQLRLINHGEEEHPFHIHVKYFQVVSVNGKPYDARKLHDMVLIPSHGEVSIRIPFDDFVGKSVYYCHLMFHNNHGMKGVFEIVKS